MSSAIYVIIRKDLKMPVGKAIAQACHAVLGLLTPDEAVVVLRVGNLEELFNIVYAAEKMRINTCLVTDAGRTVFKEPTTTCAAIGPLEKDSFPDLEKLKLY